MSGANPTSAPAPGPTNPTPAPAPAATTTQTVFNQPPNPIMGIYLESYPELEIGTPFPVVNLYLIGQALIQVQSRPIQIQDSIVPSMPHPNERATNTLLKDLKINSNKV